MTIVWICAVVLFVIIEAISVQMVCIWFAASALVTLFAALLGAPLWAQLVIFPVCTVVLLIFTRPIAKRLMKAPMTHTNADRILGMSAVVIMEIDNDLARGQVRVLNQVWSARSMGGEVLPVDTKVVVRSMEGVKVFVEKQS